MDLYLRLCKLKMEHRSIKASDTRDEQCTNVDIQALKDLRDVFEDCDSSKDMKYAQCVLIDFRNHTVTNAIYEYLINAGCDIVIVAQYFNTEQCCALFRRTKLRTPMKFDNVFAVEKYFTIKKNYTNNRSGDSTTIHIKIIEAVMKLGSHRCNFIIERVPLEHIGSTDPESRSRNVTDHEHNQKHSKTEHFSI